MTTSIRAGSVDGALQFNGVDTVAFDANGIKGVISQVTTTGGNVTLSGTPINATSIEISGTLTSNSIVIVPINMPIKSFENLTTGAFTVTVTTAAGTGFILDQGSRVPVYCGATNAETLSGLGYSQTWQAVTRTQGTTYYNTTPRPIVFSILVNAPSSGNYLAVSVNGVGAAWVGVEVGGQYQGMTCIVPPGAFYYWGSSGGGTPTITACSELR